VKSLEHPSGVSRSAIVTMIANSPIFIAEPVRLLTGFPFGFDRADILILDWIVRTGADRQLLPSPN
jgi:hypothetical protein